MPEVRAESMEGGIMVCLEMFRVKKVEVVKTRLGRHSADPFAVTRLHITNCDGEAIQIQLYHEADIDLLPAKEEK